MIKNKIVIKIFFIIYLVIGIFIYKDYGFSFDEQLE